MTNCKTRSEKNVHCAQIVIAKFHESSRHEVIVMKIQLPIKNKKVDSPTDTEYAEKRRSRRTYFLYH